MILICGVAHVVLSQLGKFSRDKWAQGSSPLCTLSHNEILIPAFARYLLHTINERDQQIFIQVLQRNAGKLDTEIISCSIWIRDCCSFVPSFLYICQNLFYDIFMPAVTLFNDIQYRLIMSCGTNCWKDRRNWWVSLVVKYRLPNIKICCDRVGFEWLEIGNVFKNKSWGMEVFTGEEKLDAEEMSLLCNRGCASIVSEVWLLKWIVLFKKKYTIQLI